MTARNIRISRVGDGITRLDLSQAGSGGPLPGSGLTEIDWQSYPLADLVNGDYTEAAHVAPTLTVTGGGKLRVLGGDTVGNVRFGLFPPEMAAWTDGEMRVTVWGENWNPATPALRGMWGFLMRHQLAADGKWRAVACWTDIAFVPYNIFAGTWEIDGSTDSGFASAGGNQLVQQIVGETASDGSRASNVVTMTIPAHHRVPVGAILNVDAADATYDGNSLGPVATRTPTQITYPQVAANDVSAGATTITVIAPFHLAARLVGAQLQFKAWAYLDPEPDWADTASCITVPDLLAVDSDAPMGPGMFGLLCGSVASNNALRYGPLEARRL